jgi:hypothetical protein
MRLKGVINSLPVADWLSLEQPVNARAQKQGRRARLFFMEVFAYHTGGGMQTAGTSRLCHWTGTRLASS